MSKESYVHRIEALRARPDAVKALKATNNAITGLIYLAYPALLLALALATGEADGPQGASHETLIRAIVVPGVSFALVSILRSAIDAPRPYERYGFEPLIPKDTQGKSFPSRHTFSIFVIGMTFLACGSLPFIGMLILALGVALAAVRVCTGVHFPRDVVAGALLGIACGVVGFYLI